MDRRLVTIREVTAIEPIAGADRIVLATVDGWKCIVQKDAFVVGQWCAYHEIDSVLPLDRPQYAFLADRHRQGATTHRLRTMKMKGVLSQGLLIKIDEIAGLGPTDFRMYADITEFCGVTKYEPPQTGVSQQQGVARVSTFPGFIPKTDLERCQNMTREIDAIIEAGETFEVTVKLDGSSMTAYCGPEISSGGPGHIGVCSRNQEIVETEEHNNPFWQAARDAHWLDALPIIADLCGGAVAIQGELIGPKIQGNPYKLEANLAVIFDVYSVRHGRYLLSAERALVLGAVHFKTGNPLTVVGIIGAGEIPGTVESMLAAVDEMNIKHGPLEGVVFKSETTQTRFKVLANSYLLNNDG